MKKDTLAPVTQKKLLKCHPINHCMSVMTCDHLLGTGIHNEKVYMGKMVRIPRNRVSTNPKLQRI